MYRLYRIEHESGEIEYFVWDEVKGDIISGPMSAPRARMAAFKLNMGLKLSEVLAAE